MIDDDDLAEIYSSAPVEKDSFEVVKLNAPWFSKIYYLQYSFVEGITITLENDENVFAEYCPMSISGSNNNGDMTYVRKLNIQYVNDLIASELQNRDYNNEEKISVEMRGYVSYRDGTVSQVKTVVTNLKADNIIRSSVGASITVSSKPVNNLSTGERVSLDKNPMLRGFI